MKTLKLDDKTLSALKMSVDICYDMQGDMLFEEIPLSVDAIRQMASKSDAELRVELRVELREVRADFDKKLDIIEGLSILKNQLSSL